MATPESPHGVIKWCFICMDLLTYNCSDIILSCYITRFIPCMWFIWHCDSAQHKAQCDVACVWECTCHDATNIPCVWLLIIHNYVGGGQIAILLILMASSYAMCCLPCCFACCMAKEEIKGNTVISAIAVIKINFNNYFILFCRKCFLHFVHSSFCVSCVWLYTGCLGMVDCWLGDFCYQSASLWQWLYAYTQSLVKTSIVKVYSL